MSGFPRSGDQDVGRDAGRDVGQPDDPVASAPARPSSGPARPSSAPVPAPAPAPGAGGRLTADGLVADRPTERLRFTGRSLLAGVAVVAAVVFVVKVLESASRVLGWALAASLAAALVAPAVTFLAHRLPRGLAIAAVMLGLLAMIGGVVYSGYGDLEDQSRRLEEAAPRAARELERSPRFGELARSVELAERAEAVVIDLPARLRGGDDQAALQAAGSRGIAFFTTAVLTLFLVLHGRRLIEGGLRLLPEDGRRVDADVMLRRAHSRWCRYVAAMAAKAVVVGLATWLLAEALALPGATLLGIAVGVASLLPMVGILVGSLVAVGLAAAQSPGRALLVLGLALALQVGEIIFVQRRIDRGTMRVGPAVTLIAAAVGLEAYGAGGMIGAVLVAALAVALTASVADLGGGDTAEGAEAVLAPDQVTDEEPISTDAGGDDPPIGDDDSTGPPVAGGAGGAGRQPGPIPDPPVPSPVRR